MEYIFDDLTIILQIRTSTITKGLFKKKTKKKLEDKMQ
jgi:hypothetical protein